MPCLIAPHRWLVLSPLLLLHSVPVHWTIASCQVDNQPSMMDIQLLPFKEDVGCCLLCSCFSCCVMSGMKIRQWPKVYDSCHTFLHVALVRKHTNMRELHVFRVQFSHACNSRMSLLQHYFFLSLLLICNITLFEDFYSRIQHLMSLSL